MGSPNEADRELMRRFLARFEPEEDYSDADVAAALDHEVTAEAVRKWRLWEWTYLHKSTRRLLRDYLHEEPALRSPTYAEGVLAAVERMEGLLAELKLMVQPATSPLDAAPHPDEAAAVIDEMNRRRPKEGGGSQ